MHIDENGKRTYSHTSLSLWRLCKRRWFHRYILHQKEPSGIAAAWSVAMVHKPVEIVASSKTFDDATWDECFQSFVELGGHEDRLHTVGTGKRILDAIRAQGPQLEGVIAEKEIVFPLTRLSSYSSRPDLVGSRGGRR